MSNTRLRKSLEHTKAKLTEQMNNLKAKQAAETQKITVKLDLVEQQIELLDKFDADNKPAESQA